MSGKIGPTQVICLPRGDPFEQNAMELDTAIRRTEEAPWSPQDFAQKRMRRDFRAGDYLPTVLP